MQLPNPALSSRLLGTAGRELRVTGTNPDYVLRGLLRCGLCGEAMCPGSTTKKSGKTYRFHRCSTRDKYGSDRCSGRPLPAGAREHVEAKLRDEAARLDDAERRLRAAEDDALDLELVESQREWFVGALRNFGKIWGEMTPENPGRLLRALVAKVSVDEKTGMCGVELVNFDAVTSTREAA